MSLSWKTPPAHLLPGPLPRGPLQVLIDKQRSAAQRTLDVEAHSSRIGDILASTDKLDEASLMCYLRGTLDVT